MRNKARLSITGSVGENGRVLTPDCPKAVHAGHASLRHPGLAVVSSGLPWKPKNTCRALTTHKHTRTSTKTQTHLHTKRSIYILTHPHVHDHSNRSSNIQIQRNTFLHETHTHTHRIIISHFLLPLTHFTEDWWIQLWSERCRNRAMDNYDVTLACSILFFLIFFLFFLFFFERMPISRYHRTNGKASTDFHEQWAVNTTTKLIMMMTLIKMMTTANERKKNKKQTTKLLSSRSLFIGQ